MKENRDRYIKRLNGIYEGGLTSLSITQIDGFASLERVDSADGTTTVRVGDKTYSSKNVLIAVGGAPNKVV